MSGTCSPSTARCRTVSWRRHTIRDTASSGWRAVPPTRTTRQRSARWCSAPTDTPGDLKRIKVSVFDGQSWSKDATAFVDVVSEPDRRSSRARSRRQQFHRRRSGRHGDVHVRRTARYRSPIPTSPSRCRRAGDHVGDDHDTRMEPARGRRALRRHAAARHHGIALQPVQWRHHAQRRGVARRLSDRAAPGGLRHHLDVHGRPRHPGDGHRQQRPHQQPRDDVHARREPAAERRAGDRPRREQLDDDRRKLSHRRSRRAARRSPSRIPTFSLSTPTIPASHRRRSR